MSCPHISSKFSLALEKPQSGTGYRRLIDTELLHFLGQVARNPHQQGADARGVAEREHTQALLVPNGIIEAHRLVLIFACEWLLDLDVALGG
jgi:hypothetical protein